MIIRKCLILEPLTLGLPYNLWHVVATLTLSSLLSRHISPLKLAQTFSKSLPQEGKNCHYSLSTSGNVPENYLVFALYCLYSLSTAQRMVQIKKLVA